MRLARLAVLFFVFALTMTAAAGVLSAQQPNDPPTAPIPTPIFTAKKVFVSNASGEIGLPAGTADLTYNEFYAAMKSWGRYELVSNPVDADLVFEIRFTFVIGPTGVSQGSGGSTQDFQFRVVILDPKCRVVLWAFSESIPQNGNKAKSRQNFDQSMANLVDDLKRLSSQSPVKQAGQKN
jgi:hypothetical protein